MTFDELKSGWNWNPLRACPGRYVLLGVDRTLAPADLLNRETEISEFVVEKAKDIVVVARLEDGGLISYKKLDGTYLHTLNTVEGFSRKLSQLGILLSDRASSEQTAA